MATKNHYPQTRADRFRRAMLQLTAVNEWTQQDIADKLGVCRFTYRKWLKDPNTMSGWAMFTLMSMMESADISWML